MIEYKEKIEKAREGMLNSQSELVKVYLATIDSKYSTLNWEQRASILSRLEYIVDSIEGKKEERSSFNYTLAKQIRVGKDITQRDLAEKLELTNQTISLYEKGKLTPSKDTEKGKKYLEWLEDNGYVPLR